MMPTYRAEKNAELLFDFPDEVNRCELDKQDVKLPVGMQLVDLVIERERDILLIEIKDPSNSRSQSKQRDKYVRALFNSSIISRELTPKARDSYLYMHLMERDGKPFKYVVLLGLDAFDPETQKGVMHGFKERLLASIQEESFEAWRRKYIEDCVVLSVESWNQFFPKWSLCRDASILTEEVAP